MRKDSKNHSVRMSQELYRRTKDTATRAGITVGEMIRAACRQFSEKEAKVRIAKKILYDSGQGDMQLIRFVPEGSSSSVNLNLYMHKNAFYEIKKMGKDADDKVMEFMRTSISDGTLLSKGEIISSDGSSDIIFFRIHLFDVTCQFGPGQITILLVS